MLRASFLLGLSAPLFSLTLATVAGNKSAPQGDASCVFDSLESPECWSDGYSLSTNWYDDSPDTGVIREYWFEVTNVTAAPDGYERIVLAINGSVPGPTIHADWGDTVVVHLHNSLTDNGTSIHWHGIRQFENSQYDGVASITQCPLAPGNATTYTWKATQYGTTWYHSHFSMQAWNGVFGGIVINGPASAPYTEDKGVIILNDWYHQTTDAQEVDAITNTAPEADNGLINGTNVSPYGGSYFNTTVTANNTYRFRLINAALDTTFQFGIDNHTLTVIAADLVPLVPYETNFVTVNIGQRYDVLVAADQDPGSSYWIRSLWQNCSGGIGNAMEGNITGILYYDEDAARARTLPTMTSVQQAASSSSTSSSTDGCADEAAERLVPYLALDVGEAAVTDVFDVYHDTFNTMSWWTINDVNFYTDWGNPTLQQVVNGATTFNASEMVNVFNESNAWVYFVIETTLRSTHPIHLHGHDFFVLGSGNGSFVPGTPLQTNNPPRRDVAMLPGYGWLVIAWPQDNPGVWLLHCHIGWHIAQGLALQLVEQVSSIEGTVDASYVGDTCDSWNAYAEAAGVVQFDSGI